MKLRSTTADGNQEMSVTRSAGSNHHRRIYEQHSGNFHLDLLTEDAVTIPRPYHNLHYTHGWLSVVWHASARSSRKQEGQGY